MNTKQRSFPKLLLIVCALVWVFKAQAGAWMQEENHGQVFVGLSFNNFQTGPHVLELNPYVEYGLSEKFTIGGNFSERYITDPTNGFKSGYHEVFVQGLLYSASRSVLSAKLSGGGSSRDVSIDTLNYVGTVEGRLQWGYGWDHFFVDLQPAYRWYGQDYSTEYRFDGTVGYKCGTKNEFYLQSFNAWADNYSLYKVQLSGLHRFNERHAGVLSVLRVLGDSRINKYTGYTLGYNFKF